MSELRRQHREFALHLFLIASLAVWVLVLFVLFGLIGVLILAGWMAVGAVIGVVFGRCFEEEE